jgi:hypothetical protein
MTTITRTNEEKKHDVVYKSGGMGRRCVRGEEATPLAGVLHERNM